MTSPSPRTSPSPSTRSSAPASTESDEFAQTSSSDDLAIPGDATLTTDKEFGTALAPADDDAATAGDSGLTFKVKVTNTGQSDADNVTITDAAPAGLVFDSE